MSIAKISFEDGRIQFRKFKYGYPVLAYCSNGDRVRLFFDNISTERFYIKITSADNNYRLNISLQHLSADFNVELEPRGMLYTCESTVNDLYRIDLTNIKGCFTIRFTIKEVDSPQDSLDDSDNLDSTYDSLDISDSPEISDQSIELETGESNSSIEFSYGRSEYLESDSTELSESDQSVGSPEFNQSIEFLESDPIGLSEFNQSIEFLNEEIKELIRGGIMLTTVGFILMLFAKLLF